MTEAAFLNEVSALDWAASAIYTLVMLAALAAAFIANDRQQRPWHLRVWTLLSILFAVLVLFRLLALEDMLRGSLRTALRADGSYSGRDVLQRSLVAGILVMVAAAGMVWANKLLRKVRGRRNIAVIFAAISGAGLLVLIAIRLVSWHLTDKLLYGPLKLNWLMDIGLSCTILGASLYYVSIIRKTR